MEARREELFGQSAYCSSMPALSPRKRAGHQAFAPLLTRPRYEAPGAWMEIEMAARGGSRLSPVARTLARGAWPARARTSRTPP